MTPRWVNISVAALLTLGTGQAMANEALARKSGCFECHGLDRRVVGPSFHDIAAKYKGDARSAAALIKAVKNGGKGNWSEVSHEVPMPPYSKILSDAEIKRLVDWLLGL